MKKIVLFNGCPSAGKDYAAKYLASKYSNIKIDKFARVLKERTHALYGYSWRPHDYYELVKDQSNEDFYGLTPRQAYINVSEVYFKTQHGKNIFGQILSKELDKYYWEILIITDSGFKEEAEVLINKYGHENIILVRIHREGYNFNTDSRNFIYLDKNICNIDIINDGTDIYLNTIDNLIQNIK